MAVRMREVARAAGVSEATVSLALSGSSRVSDATRTRIVEIAERLGYHPHAGARSLRTDSTRALGLVVSDVANPFFAELAGQIERAAGAEGFSLVLCNSDEDAARQDGYLNRLLAGSQVDGVMLVPTSDMTPGIRAAAGAPLVLLDRPITVPDDDPAAGLLRAAPVVRSRSGPALTEAATLLADLGHRRIGFIAPPLSSQVGQERRDQLAEAVGMRGGELVVEVGDFRQTSGERATERLLSAARPPTALVAGDGLMAIGALKALRRAGVQVPEDISVIAFDDAPWFDLFGPPLTAVAQPIADLARAAVRAMLGRLGGRPAGNSFPTCRLVRRDSCAPPADPPGAGPAHRPPQRRDEGNPS